MKIRLREIKYWLSARYGDRNIVWLIKTAVLEVMALQAKKDLDDIVLQMKKERKGNG